ncbi:MAG TPA: beta-ketoacyl-[acyl-carrier-protein] synthase family protein, partial [Thermoanaerobaculia bacterium]|nr:beta-ketoacyl-[acyl-carrier-protein] synthase family protein [Thermoanaerobaculia bacterium]
MAEERRVVVTGLGAVTSLGNTLAETWNGLVEGRCGIRRITLFDPTPYRTQLAAEVPILPDGFAPAYRRRLSRSDVIGLTAAAEALADSGLELASEDPMRIGVVLGGGVSGLLDSENYFHEKLGKGTGTRRPRPTRVLNHPPDQTTDRIAQRWGFLGPRGTVTTACSSSGTSLGYAADLIRHGLADIVVTGGADSFARLTHGGFNVLRAVDPEPCRPFDRRRKGLTIGEGAGILIFEEEGRARRRGARIHARFLGYGVTSDAHHMTQPEPSGEAGARTIAACLESARVDASRVDYVNAHGTATPQNDSAETAAIRRALGSRADEIPVSSIKSMIGHCLCSAGAVEAVATVMTITTGVVPPTIHYAEPDPECDLDVVPNVAREVRVRVAISNSFAFGGNSTVVAFGE